MENLNLEFNNILQQKSMYNAVEKDKSNLQKNIMETRQRKDVNIKTDDDISLSQNITLPKTTKPSNLADTVIFDDEGNLNLQDMMFPLIFLFVGKTASGKSVAIKNLIYNYSKLSYFKFILAIVPSKFNSGYDYLTDKYVIESYDENYLKNYFNKLKEFKKKSGFIPENALILDDVMGAINLYSPFWQHFISTYRHYNCTIIFGTQSLTGKGGVSTLLRQCCNVCVMYRNVFHDNIENLYKAVGGLMDNYEEFEKTFLSVTSTKYHALMFCNDRESKEETYYDYISEVAPDFKLNY